MTRILRLIPALIRLNLQVALAYRADMITDILVNLMWLGWELLGLSIIFSNTTTLGGWRLGDLIALLGVFHLVNALMSALIFPNTERFNTAVRDGSLDYTLLQPVDSLFMVTFTRINLWRAWDLLLAIALLVVGIRMGGGSASPFHTASFIVLCLSGTAIIYSLWIVMIAVTFWFVKFDNNVTILSALLATGRYPATIYPAWLRLIVTFVIPIAVATTVPLQALRGEVSAWQGLLYLVVSGAAFFIARRIWLAGVRKYSGASS